MKILSCNTNVIAQTDLFLLLGLKAYETATQRCIITSNLLRSSFSLWWSLLRAADSPTSCEVHRFFQPELSIDSFNFRAVY